MRAIPRFTKPPVSDIANCISFWAAPSASVCFGLPAQVNQLEGTKVRERLFRAFCCPKNETPKYSWGPKVRNEIYGAFKGLKMNPGSIPRTCVMANPSPHKILSLKSRPWSHYPFLRILINAE